MGHIRVRVIRNLTRRFESLVLDSENDLAAYLKAMGLRVTIWLSPALPMDFRHIIWSDCIYSRTRIGKRYAQTWELVY
jgi:hypothetical protein